MRIVNDIVLVNSRCVSLQDKWLRIYLIGNIVRIFEPHQSDLWLCQTIKSRERMNCISEWIFWHVETKQLFYWFGNQKRLKIKKRFQSRNSLYSEKVCFIFLCYEHSLWAEIQLLNYNNSNSNFGIEFSLDVSILEI